MNSQNEHRSDSLLNAFLDKVCNCGSTSTVVEEEEEEGHEWIPSPPEAILNKERSMYHSPVKPRGDDARRLAENRSSPLSIRSPLSRTDTNTTVSMDQSLRDHDEDNAWEVSSTVTTEAISHCFRRSRSDDAHGDGGAYRMLLRMQPQNYVCDTEEASHTRSFYQGAVLFQPPLNVDRE